MSDTPSVLVAGETLVDFLPNRVGPLTEVETFDRRAGGAPANVAVALAQLEETPWFLSNLAADAFGDFLSATLDDYGVPDRFVTRDEDHQTALAFVTHDVDADRSFSFYREDTADLHVDATVVPDETLDEVEWVVVGGVMLAADPARTATFDLVERAREHDCQVVFDPNSRPELWADADTEAEVVSRMLGLADVVKTSAEDFARADYPDDPEAFATALLEAGPHTVLLTLGGAGSAFHAAEDAPWGETAVEHEGYPVDPEDTTGAGDAFLGGALAALCRGDGPEEVLAFANAVAAVTTTDTGAMAALPTREEVEAFQAERE
ncbi:carbohydrate kinase family protein [Halospeciosus flavus]|uniref:Carbohydrate kinase family protein n=1 Tax=Halospeciosus flavus TaxID=3032283 RepID=A0ABD5Z4I3_9EURY|nr:carbohydrate kinase [Halospeciosus flavus]